MSRSYTAEVKFVIDTTVGDSIREWARTRLDPDPHGGGDHDDEYPVTSLYLDTAARDVFHRRGSYGRSKYRIRRYAENDTVFLERKLRTSQLLSKRRSTVDVAILPSLAHAPEAHMDGIAWFRRRVRIRRLHPVCQVTYDRVARLAETPDGPARLTLDRALNVTMADSFGFQPTAGLPFLDGQMVLELKYRDTPPPVFKELVEAFALTPGRSSKYRSAVQALGLASEYV